MTGEAGSIVNGKMTIYYNSKKPVGRKDAFGPTHLRFVLIILGFFLKINT